MTRATPTALKIIRGNPGKRPINGREPKPPVAALICPEHLSPIAAIEWARIVPILVDLGVATTADRSVLIAYCELYAEMVERSTARKEQRTAAIAQLRACMVELGLTPAARAKMTVQAKHGDETEAKYFGTV